MQVLDYFGPNLRFPYSSGVKGSKLGHMWELRIQHKGKPYRVLYAFDPRRTGILLVGGNKQGNKNWYKKFIPIAEALYDNHIRTLQDKNNGK